MLINAEKKYYKAGVLLFTGADILDFTGPMEVLLHVLHNRNPDGPDRMFAIETIAQSPTIRAANVLTVKVDTLLEDAVKKLADYDMLIIPGGPPSVVQPLVESSSSHDLHAKAANLVLRVHWGFFARWSRNSNWDDRDYSPPSSRRASGDM